ncbi:MAG: hypothetical protein AAF517_24235 [Planctomycetota bacterium]
MRRYLIALSVGGVLILGILVALRWPRNFKHPYLITVTHAEFGEERADLEFRLPDKFGVHLCLTDDRKPRSSDEHSRDVSTKLEATYDGLRGEYYLRLAIERDRETLIVSDVVTGQEFDMSFPEPRMHVRTAYSEGTRFGAGMVTALWRSEDELLSIGLNFWSECDL